MSLNYFGRLLTGPGSWSMTVGQGIHSGSSLPSPGHPHVEAERKHIGCRRSQAVWCRWVWCSGWSEGHSLSVCWWSQRVNSSPKRNTDSHLPGRNPQVNLTMTAGRNTDVWPEFWGSPPAGLPLSCLYFPPAFAVRRSFHPSAAAFRRETSWKKQWHQFPKQLKMKGSQLWYQETLRGTSFCEGRW